MRTRAIIGETNTWRRVLAVAGLAVSLAHGQGGRPEPKIGYLYPAGACRGTTIEVLAGGQALKDVKQVRVSGQGVTARVIRTYRGVRNLNGEQRQMLQWRIACRRAEIHGRKAPPAPEIPEGPDGKPAKQFQLPEMPFLDMLDNLDADVAARVAAYPISIDPERFREFTAAAAADTPPLGLPDASMLFFGVERLDYTKGIPDRLEAYEHALATSPEMRDGTRFVQWAAPSRTGVPEYQDERDAVEAAAQRVNVRFPEHPLTIDFDPHPPEVVAPALEQADVCVVSSVTDGMNLVAKEFAAVHSAENPGVLVMSDMCGAAEELTDALIFPARDIRAMSAAMRWAYYMPEHERRGRAARLRAVVDGHTSWDWLREFVTDLREVMPRTRAPEPRLVHPRPTRHERGTPPPIEVGRP